MNGVRGLNGVFAVVRVRFCFEVVLYLQFKGVGRSGSISLLSGSSHRRFSGSGRLGHLARWCSTAVWQAGARGFHLEVAFHRRFSEAGASRFDFVCWRFARFRVLAFHCILWSDVARSCFGLMAFHHPIR